MCNCGHDVEAQDEADALKKKATLTAVGAACMAAVPAVFSAPGPAHHAIVFGVVALELGLIARTLLLVHRRRLLLTCSREALISR